MRLWKFATRRNGAYVAAAAALIAVVGALATLTLGAFWQVEIPGVSSQRLAAAGLSLSTPDNPLPPINQAFAERVAESSYPSLLGPGAAREVVLAVVTDSFQKPPMKRLCWVVAAVYAKGIDLPGPIGQSNSTAHWFLVCVDANTGSIALAEGGS